ncbi:hypothetical protein M5K25_022833 [Dendrobium thyrsiflorum]|uniref:Uncharacterized protein n=1 Tax=Dendrobium thyrsiflorum TaxID=117978 RepID=A0ABD0U6S0_DENTH
MAVNRIKDPGFLDGKVKSRSFRDALSGESSSPVFPRLKFLLTTDPPSSCLPTVNDGGGNLGGVVVNPVCDEILEINVVVPSLLGIGVPSLPQCDVIFLSLGDFVLPQLNNQENLDMPSINSDEVVGESALAVSNVDMQRDVGVNCENEIGNTLADGMVSNNNNLEESMLPSHIGIVGDMEVPLLGGPEGALVDFPLVVMSPKGLLAQFVHPSGITCSGFSDRDAVPSPPSSVEGDDFGDDLSFQDLYSLNVGKRANASF